MFYTHHTHIKDDEHHHHHIPLNLCGEGHTHTDTHVRFSNIKKKKLHGQTQTIITHTPRYNKPLRPLGRCIRINFFPIRLLSSAIDGVNEYFFWSI